MSLQGVMHFSFWVFLCPFLWQRASRRVVASQHNTLIDLCTRTSKCLGRRVDTLIPTHFIEMSNNPPCPPFTPLPPPNQLDLKVHTAQDGSQWVNNGGQWVRYDTHPSLQQMDVDSLRPVGNLHQFAPPPAPGIQDHRAPEQYNFSIRSISSAPPYASSSHIPIDPRLIPLPHGNDHDLTDPAAIANAKGLKPAKKVAGARHIDKDPKGKKRRLDSDSEDDRPTNKRGRPSGSQNFSAADKKALFDPVQQELPLGGKGWKAVHQIYDTYRRANNRAKRSVSSLETKYKGYLKLKKPTGDGICPPEVKRVYEIEALINERAGTRELNDSDIDDLASSAGSSDNDDEIQVIDKPEVRTAVAQRARTPPLHRQRRGAPELVDKLTRAFDPEVQKARDEDRYQRAAQNTQLFTLSQQLRDSHTSAESLRNQLTIMQQHLNDAERSRDVALLKLEMMDYRGNQGDRGLSEFSRPLSPSPITQPSQNSI
ncbi:hypothetical protein DFH07DRAFT_146407 [Mycena maculata]|uniref:DUF6818 domain-containing protein n=1 Tax=Mycena maculata TaxID=230809 RepID=A0AAD7JVT1_9AGAR|nr:hypothetical protein DFH07DRAFT_146407 [Mycena maculata]